MKRQYNIAMESKVASGISSSPHDKVVDEAALRKSVGSNTTNTTQSRDDDSDSVLTCSSVDSNEMMLSLAANSTATIETSNINRGRGRSRSRKVKKKSGRKNLRTKFILESLYVEISTLKKENEMLREILGNIQQSKDIQDRVENLGLENKTSQGCHRVPCTVSVSTDADAGSNSDLLQDLSTSDREWESHIKKGEGGSGKYNYTTEDTEDEDIHQLLYS